jgi:hypothetical protein
VVIPGFTARAPSAQQMAELILTIQLAPGDLPGRKGEPTWQQIAVSGAVTDPYVETVSDASGLPHALG